MHIPCVTAPGRGRLARAGLLALLALAAALVPARAAPAQSPKVEPALLEQLDAAGSATFLVLLRDQADLSGAGRFSRREERATFVYQQLRATAERSQARLRGMLAARGASFTPFWIVNAIKVTGDRALVDAVAARPEVAQVQAERIYPVPAVTPATPLPGVNAVEWNVSNVRAPEVWSAYGTRGEGIVVASIDTGAQYDHPALVRQYRGNLGGGQFDHAYDWFDATGTCPNPGVPCDNNGHGTHTMGTMVGDDGAGNQIGVAPGARWITAKGCSVTSCLSSDLLAAGQWIAAPTDPAGRNPRPDLAPDVVNNSWGGGRGDAWYQQTIRSWIAAGIFPVFSIGNSGPGCGTANSPGDNPQAYGVGAHDSGNVIASFSSRGPSAFGGVKPDVTAPGVAVRSSFPTSTYRALSGTSMAGPHVAGAVALAWSAAPALRGDVTATRQVLDAAAVDTADLACGGTAGDNNVYGEGRLDALAAVERARAS